MKMVIFIPDFEGVLGALINFLCIQVLILVVEILVVGFFDVIEFLFVVCCFFLVSLFGEIFVLVLGVLAAIIVACGEQKVAAEEQKGEVEPPLHHCTSWGEQLSLGVIETE